MFATSIAGSLPKPEWLAETQKLWPQWKLEGDALRQAKADATLLWIKTQEDAGLDIIGDGEQARQHFVHGFLEQVEGIDFANKVKMGIRNNRYDAMVPQVIAPLRLKGRVHAMEAQLLRAHTKRKIKFTLPGPMTIVDTVADRYYGQGEEGRIKMAMAFAELLNQEALALQADLLIGTVLVPGAEAPKLITRDIVRRIHERRGRARSHEVRLLGSGADERTVLLELREEARDLPLQRHRELRRAPRAKHPTRVALDRAQHERGQAHDDDRTRRADRLHEARRLPVGEVDGQRQQRDRDSALEARPQGARSTNEPTQVGRGGVESAATRLPQASSVSRSASG